MNRVTSGFRVGSRTALAVLAVLAVSALARSGEFPFILDALKSVEGNWGVIDEAGNKLPAYHTLYEIAREVEIENTAGTLPRP